MIIGVPKEIKNHEYRAGMTPSSVHELTLRHHQVIVESQLGSGIAYSDADYINAGAVVVNRAEEVFAQAEMIVKVKEPLAEERKRLTNKHILFTYLHLAPDAAQTQDLLDSRAVCIAYETITSPSGQLPLLMPMSEVAGRMSIQAGAFCLEKSHGGQGILLGGVPGVEPAKVVIIGGGVVGSHAAQMALGLGADVIILDSNLATLRALNQTFGTKVKLIHSNKASLMEQVISADLVIGSVLIPGAAAPKLVTAEMIKQMKTGAVVVDVAIDQGGCFETSKPTTHQDPTYIVDGVVHYCVANMPGAVARTSTQALNNATLPYIIKLADNGWKKTLSDDKHFLNGLNVCAGNVTNKAVAENLGYDYVDPQSLLI
jgi:alanine dehydrogenase